MLGVAMLKVLFSLLITNERALQAQDERTTGDQNDQYRK